MLWMSQLMVTTSGGSAQETLVKLAEAAHALPPMPSSAITVHGTFSLGRSPALYA